MSSTLRQIGARRVITAVLAIGLVGAVAVPAIYAASSASAPAAAGTDAAANAGAAGQLDDASVAAANVRLGGGLLGRVVRGDLTVRGKGGTYVQVHYERGQITAVSATSITITGADGKGATFAVTATTKVRSKGQLEKTSDLSTGQAAMVFGTGSNGTYSAVLIRGIVARAAVPAGGASNTP